MSGPVGAENVDKKVMNDNDVIIDRNREICVVCLLKHIIETKHKCENDTLTTIASNDSITSWQYT